MSIQILWKSVLKYLPVLTYAKYRRQRSVHYTATTIFVSVYSFHIKVRFFTNHCLQRRLPRNWHRMSKRSLCVVPASLWWVLESPPLAQSDAICVLSRCHKLILSHQERYPMTTPSRSSFFPVELSKFEYITSLKRIAFVQCFWQRLVPSWHSRYWRSDLRHSVNLSCCRFWSFCIRSIQQRDCVPHKICIMSQRLA